MAMKKIKFMDLSFRDGFQSVYGARVKTEDFLPAIKASKEAGIDHFEFGGGARFQSLFFYCGESAFDMMDKIRKEVGKDVKLQTLARGINVVGLSQQPKDIINLHAVLFKKHGTTIIRNFDALNDTQNLDYSGHCIKKAGLEHQITIALMGLPPGVEDKTVHTAEFYMEKLDEILEKEIPFDSIVFKDASGTCPPRIVHETIKLARKKLGKNAVIWFHTHDTAGLGAICLMSAIEAGADGIDLAQSPVSGGTSHVDILSAWHMLKGSNYTLDIDYKKIMESRKIFEECMSKYMMPPEAKETSANIVLSPMPGGALTANTMMMRDNGTLNLYPKVIEEMADVVAKGGFGTSVTPVSQFYFQQAYTNVVMGKWKKITDGYGNMVLGYFGKTPRTPDKEIIKLASEQLKKPIFEGKNCLEVLEDGIPQAKKILKENNLELSDENIFIVATCKDKGLDYLKGNYTVSIYYKEEKKENKVDDTKNIQEKINMSNSEKLIVKVNGVEYDVEVVSEGRVRRTSSSSSARSTAPSRPSRAEAPAPAKSAPAASPAPSSASVSASSEAIKAPIAGQVLDVIASEGSKVSEGDNVLILEAMKMENEIPAPKSGTISKIYVKKGDFLKEGDPLFEIS